MFVAPGMVGRSPHSGSGWLACQGRKRWWDDARAGWRAADHWRPAHPMGMRGGRLSCECGLERGVRRTEVEIAVGEALGGRFCADLREGCDEVLERDRVEAPFGRIGRG